MLQEYHNILVPIDGSYEADLTFQKAVAVAKRNNAKLHLVHVIDTRSFQNLSSFDASMIDDITQGTKKTLDNYLKKAKQEGVNDTSYSIEYGYPKMVIAKQVPKDLGIDLIMIGATGLNAMERLLIGSVTEFVCKEALCDVLIVRTNLKNELVSPKAGKRNLTK